MAKMCESCGMPLRKDGAKGIKADGNKSERYCVMCYKDGEFIHPDATAEEMRKHSVEGMVKDGWPKFVAKFLTKNTAKLPRWQQKDSSKPVE